MKNPLKRLFGVKPDMGVISLWHGPKKYIPSSYVECNGQNGTPDMRQAGGQLGVTFIKRVR